MTRTTSSRSIFSASVLGGLSALLIVALGGMGCQNPFEPTPILFKTEDWTYKGAKGLKLKSDRYEIYSTCKRKPFVEALPGFLETCYKAYDELLPTETVPAEPLKTYLFKTRPQWERFTEEFSPRRAPTYKRIRRGGYSERGITASHYSSQRSTLSILAHEGLHQYLEITGRHQIPAWVNEGLACYFESFELDGNNRPVFKPNMNTLRSPSLRKALAADSLIPLREVLATNAGIVVQGRSQRVQSCYAQWWSLVLFLLQPSSSNRYSEGFGELLDELGSEAMKRKANGYLAADTDNTLSFGEAVFQAYITEDLETFESDYKKYLYKLLNLRTY